MQIGVFVLMMVIGQLLFKASAQHPLIRNKESIQPAFGLLLDWRFLLGLALYGTATLLWMRILKSTPLSTAYPLAMGSTIATVSLLGAAIFHEVLPPIKLAGIALVVIALIFLSR